MKLNPIGSNQTEIERDGVTVLFSYKTPVCAFIQGRGMIRTRTHYGTTTSRHINAARERWGASKAEEVDQEELDKLAI